MRMMIKAAVISPWTLQKTVYTGKLFSVSSQDLNPVDFFLKSDGTKLYMEGLDNKRIYQYSLSTAWDISTASYDNVSFSFSAQTSGVTGIFIGSSGSKMFLVGDANSAVYQYSLSTAWDISTASYDNVSFSFLTEGQTPSSVFFKSDGTILYSPIVITGSIRSIYQYSLSTAWDISTASYANKSFAITPQNHTASGIFLSSGGRKMIVVGQNLPVLPVSINVYQYSLSTAWDISTASYDSVSFSITNEETSAQGLHIKKDGTVLYVIGNDTDAIYQYSL